MSAQLNWHFLGSVPENYERYLVPSIFASWADDLVERAALLPGECALDVACGTGIVARFAARKLGNIGNVTGLDASAPMLTAARAAAIEEGLVVEWREGSAQELPFADAAFDVVLCQQGLQFFPDKSSALREMNRVLRPGGRLVLSVWGPIERSPGFAVLAEALRRHVSPAACELIASGPFGLGDAEELRALIAGADFRDITVRAAVKTLRYRSPAEFVLGYVASSPLASAVGNADASARASLLAEVGAKLAHAVDDRGLGFSIETNIAVARC
jgi:ubiquinone/menaquinone biosynthesis C-methylase UbiE